MLHAGVVVCDVVVIVVKTNEIVEYCPLIRGYRYREGTVQQIGGARWWKRDGERRSEVLNLSISSHVPSSYVSPLLAAAQRRLVCVGFCVVTSDIRNVVSES